MKSFLTFIVSCVLGSCPSADAPETNIDSPPQKLASIETKAGEYERDLYAPFQKRSLSGNYLASQFAQRHHDWSRAGDFIDPLLEATPEDSELINKAMVLAMGSGKNERAQKLAKLLLQHEDQKNNSLALMFVALDDFKNKNYDAASALIKKMPEGSLSDFIMPLLESWSYAALGEHNTKGLDGNTIHIHHAILIAEFLDQTDHVERLLQQSLGASGLSLSDLERIADTYHHIEKDDVALELYTKLFEEWPENRELAHKIEAVQSGKDVSFMKRVETPEQGVAEALFDTAQLLFQEQSDESARVFSHMALFLNPSLTDAQLLLGYVTARNKQYDEAIGYYQRVKPNNERYGEARRMAADLLESAGRIDEALAELDHLVKNNKDLEALIQIGDIQRRNEDFEDAVKTYNKAAKIIGNPIPKEYWQVYYVRGMSYERLGKWQKAEADLSAALEYQPDNPLILNYLGYAWADQGINLKQSLELIRKAAALRPTDGYIIDSLGWVLYKTGAYEEAVPHLEKAVELLPYDPIINDHLGDAYWRVGRKLEARFQWLRAQNHAEEEEIVQNIQDKLDNGMKPPAIRAVEEAKKNDSADGKI